MGRYRQTEGAGRQRARAEKLLLQVVLRRLDDAPAFRDAVLGQLDAAALKPAEYEAVRALLTAQGAARSGTSSNDAA